MISGYNRIFLNLDTFTMNKIFYSTSTQMITPHSCRTCPFTPLLKIIYLFQCIQNSLPFPSASAGTFFLTTHISLFLLKHSRLIRASTAFPFNSFQCTNSLFPFTFCYFPFSQYRKLSRLLFSFISQSRLLPSTYLFDSFFPLTQFASISKYTSNTHIFFLWYRKV